MILKHTSPSVLVIAALVWCAAPASAQQASPLPGGASSLQETYQDWQVACSVQGQSKRCALSQQQSQQNGQRILAVEFAPTAEKLTGTLVLPFGLLLASGVEVQVDDNAAGTPMTFRTCLPNGCVVPLTFDAASIKRLRAGTALKLKAVRADNEQPLTFSISLKGFATALDRTGSLLK